MAARSDPQQVPAVVVVLFVLFGALGWWWVAYLGEEERQSFLAAIIDVEQVERPLPRPGEGMATFSTGNRTAPRGRLGTSGDKRLEDWAAEGLWLMEHRSSCLEGYVPLILQGLCFGGLSGGLWRKRHAMGGFGLGLFALARVSVLFLAAGFTAYLLLPLPIPRVVGGPLLAAGCGLSAYLFARGRPRVH